MLTAEQFTTISKLQKELDVKILNTHHLQEKDTFNARFVALLVELAEFANEQRCFKYWSSKPSSARNILLEEYVDCLHFILSIGNSLEIDYQNYQFVLPANSDNLNLLFIALFSVVTTLFMTKSSIDFFQLLNIYWQIGTICQFSSKDIINSYLSKNKINHVRQQENY